MIAPPPFPPRGYEFDPDKAITGLKITTPILVITGLVVYFGASYMDGHQAWYITAVWVLCGALAWVTTIPFILALCIAPMKFFGNKKDSP